MGTAARRAASNVIAEALLIVVGVTLAAALASAVLSRVSVLQSRLSGLMVDVAQGLSERLGYVYATYSESRGCFVVYVKNVGRYPVYPIDQFTVMFGELTDARLYSLSTSPSVGCGCWSYEELGVANGVMEPGELVVFYIYNTTSVRPPYYLKLVTARGSALEVEFAS